MQLVMFGGSWLKCLLPLTLAACAAYSSFSWPCAWVECTPVLMLQGRAESQCMAVKETPMSTLQEGRDGRPGGGGAGEGYLAKVLPGDKTGMGDGKTVCGQ